MVTHTDTFCEKRLAHKCLIALPVRVQREKSIKSKERHRELENLRNEEEHFRSKLFRWMCNRPNKNQCDLFRWSNCRTKHVLHLITTHKPTHTRRDIESMCTEIMVLGVIVSSFPQWNGKKHLHKCGLTWAKSDLNICSIFFPETRLIWWDWAWLLLLLSSKSSFHQLT